MDITTVTTIVQVSTIAWIHVLGCPRFSSNALTWCSGPCQANCSVSAALLHWLYASVTYKFVAVRHSTSRSITSWGRSSLVTIIYASRERGVAYSRSRTAARVKCTGARSTFRPGHVKQSAMPINSSLASCHSPWIFWSDATVLDDYALTIARMS